jgi:peptide/nickel transport system ATP-binding protein
MPYTQSLLASLPDWRRPRQPGPLPSLPGQPPSLVHIPSGCPFHPRCTHREKVPGDLCVTTLPELLPAKVGGEHRRRCHLPDPEEIYRSEVLPELVPELDDEVAQ